MKKYGIIGFAFMAMVLYSSNLFAQASTYPNYYSSYDDDNSVGDDAQDEPGAPVSFKDRPSFDAANYGMDVMRVNRVNVFQMNGNAKTNDGPGAAAATSMQQGGLPMNSMIRYEHTEFDGVDADSDRIGIAVRTQWVWDRVTLDAALPIDHVSFDDEYNEFDFTRFGLVLTPRFNLLSQDTNMVDLDFGVNAFYMHTCFESDNAYKRLITTENTEEESADHVGIGPIMTVMKDFNKWSLGVGAMWQRGYNLGGDEEFFDDKGNRRSEDLDIGKIGVNVGVPVGDRWYFTGIATYHHTWHNYADLDSDWVTVGLGATYMLNDKWSLDCMLDTDIGQDDLDSRIQASIGAVWRF